jgi:hypothetical protein
MKATRFFASKAITGYNRCGVYFSFDKFVGTAKKFSSDNDNGGGSVPDLFVLFLGEVNENSSSGMLNRQQRQDGGAVIRYRDFLHYRWRSS